MDRIARGTHTSRPESPVHGRTPGGSDAPTAEGEGVFTGTGMKRLFLRLLPLLLLIGCGRPAARLSPPAPAPAAPGGQPDKGLTLAEARRGFQTKLVRKEAAHEPVPEPPRRLFRTVRYE